MSSNSVSLVGELRESEMAVCRRMRAYLSAQADDEVNVSVSVSVSGSVSVSSRVGGASLHEL